MECRGFGGRPPLNRPGPAAVSRRRSLQILLVVPLLALLVVTSLSIVDNLRSVEDYRRHVNAG